jgi:hypothetical protein
VFDILRFAVEFLRGLLRNRGLELQWPSSGKANHVLS